MGTGTNLIKYVLLTAISSTVIPLSYEDSGNIMPSTIDVEYNFDNKTAWRYDPIMHNTETIISSIESQKLDIIIDFSKSLIKNSTEIDPEFTKIVNDNFWELLS